MSDAADAKAADPKHERPMCDHICLLEDGHVDRGEPHFYGYELPSPRLWKATAVAQEDELNDIEESYGRFVDRVATIVNEMRDGVSPECSQYAERLIVLIKCSHVEPCVCGDPPS